jgi:nucleoside 2-deoxyribosyltransferase
MKKIYLACALNQVPDEFTQRIQTIRSQIAGLGEILDFVGLRPDITAQEVFDHDIHCVKSADIIIAFVDYPSLGLGIELGFALNHGKQIVALAQTDSQVTRMVTGITSPQFRLFRYIDIDEAVEIIRNSV